MFSFPFSRLTRRSQNQTGFGVQKIRNPNIEISAFAEAASPRQAKQIRILKIQMS
jgi:hypothetical protein